MGTTGEFALLIGGSLHTLNELGRNAGFILLLSTIALWYHSGPRTRRLLALEAALTVLMILATMIVEFRIVPTMERDRAAAGGDITAVAQDSTTRKDFDHLHALSEKVEGAAIFLGLGIVLLVAAEPVSAPGKPTRTGRIRET